MYTRKMLLLLPSTLHILMPFPALPSRSELARHLGTGALEDCRAGNDVFLGDRVVVDWDLVQRLVSHVVDCSKYGLP